MTMNTNTSPGKPLKRDVALRELRALVGTYLEGSDDAARATELLDAVDAHPTTTAIELTMSPDPTQEAHERLMFGCTAAALDEALAGKEPRDIAMFAMGTLSDAQRRIPDHSAVSESEANTLRQLRQLINIAKYAIGKAVPR